MKKIEFKVNINAAPQKVWSTMLSPETYRQWVNASWPDSFYEGNWKKGENIRFIGPDGSGTLATLTEHKPHQYIHAEHVAVLQSGGVEDRQSDIAKGWIGTTESYTFTENEGQTELTVEINTNPDWASMFNEGWPKALAKLKEICEN